MMGKLKVIRVGNSRAVLLSKELLTKLRVDTGDILYTVETQDGIELRSYDPEFARQMEIAERIIHEDRDILKRLADS